MHLQSAGLDDSGLEETAMTRAKERKDQDLFRRLVRRARSAVRWNTYILGKGMFFQTPSVSDDCGLPLGWAPAPHKAIHYP